MDTKRDKKRAMAQLGIKKLVNYQIAPINSILDENDTFVIAPPSVYRSEIFQIPALMFPGLTLVIEPTVTLLYERVGKLQLYDVRADYLDSSRTNAENVNILRKAQKGKLELLFVTPERLQNQRFQREIEDVFISLVVVDEAHCVTSWGYGFQSAFLKIGEFIDSLPDSPTKIALTATAPPQERENICELLFMEQANVFINSLYRSNLHFVKYVHISDRGPRLHGVLAPPCRRRAPLLQERYQREGSASRGGGQSQGSVIILGDGDAVGSQNGLQHLSAFQIKA